jgi:hypothetical protein
MYIYKFTHVPLHLNKFMSIYINPDKIISIHINSYEYIYYFGLLALWRGSHLLIY